MLRKIVLFIFIITCSLKIFAQDEAPVSSDEENVKGFRKDNIFVGGSIGLGFASYTFNIGVNPEIGYTLAQWLDAGIAFNLNYTSQHADPYYNNNVRQRSFNYGGGVFFRAYPIRFIFLQGQLEENWIHYNIKDFNNNITHSTTTQSTSLLAGIGYTQRIVGQSSFYTAILIDLLTDPNSPYRDYNNAAIPIIRAGFDFYLRPRKHK